MSEVRPAVVDASGRGTAPGPRSTLADVIEPVTSRSLSHRLAAGQAELRLPSVAAALVRGGSVVWSDAHGTLDGRSAGAPAGPGTQYRIGSITKTFVAVLVMRLRDEGLLDLDDPLERHLPGTPIGHVTIAQLLSHTAGLSAETDGAWWERTPGRAWDDLGAALVLRHPPGRRHHYSNVGFAVLGELVTRRRATPWAEVVRTELLAPLGMSRTTTRPVSPHAQGMAVHPFADVLLPEPEHDAAAMAAAGQLWSTVEDLARWAAFLGGDTAGLLASGTLEQMREPLTLDDEPGEPWTGAHGLGLQVWNLQGRRYVGHGGSMPGFLALVKVEVETGDGVAIMCNSTTGLAPALPNDLLDTLHRLEPLPVTAWHASTVDASLLDLVGPWYWGPAPFELRAAADGGVELGPTGGGGRASRFRPTGPGCWLGLDGYYAGEELRVVRGAAGAYLDLASFRFTRTPYDPDADVPGGVDTAGWR